MDVYEKLRILTDAAKYDASCASSGIDRKVERGGGMGATLAGGICHSFAGDGRCVTLLKVLFSNCCAYDCSYCVNRRSGSGPRASFEPRELADLTMEFYRRNYIEGLFLSSGILKNPDYTCEQMLKTLTILRREYGFGGYIHVKAIPGADSWLTTALGYLADRMSVNIELPSAGSLKQLAPDKSKDGVFSPMRLIRDKLLEGEEGTLLDGGRRTVAPVAGRYAGENYPAPGGGERKPAPRRRRRRKVEAFAPAGQSTQMIIGASPETDRQILNLSQGLYRSYRLKRVYYSAYISVVESVNLPAVGTPPPLWREHRLYQADWLMRCYGFSAGEILDERHAFLHPYLDPKCQWALRHPELFPMEVNRASYEELLRVPGLGVDSARRIVRARRVCSLSWDALRNIGVVLKRARYFLLCRGKTFPGLSRNRQAFLRAMLSDRERKLYEKREKWGQLSLFDDGSDSLGGSGGCGSLLHGGSPWGTLSAASTGPMTAVSGASAGRSASGGTLSGNGSGGLSGDLLYEAGIPMLTVAEKNEMEWAGAPVWE